MMCDEAAKEKHKVVDEFDPIEYKVVEFGTISSAELANELNRFGRDGWDLVKFGLLRSVFKRK